MIEPIEIFLTIPPSTNKTWVPVRTRAGAAMVKRKVAERWAAEAQRMVREQRQGVCISGPCRILMEFPGDMPGDLDNRQKPILDACQKGGLITNDKLFVAIQAERDAGRRGNVRLVLTPIPPERRAPAGSTGDARMETSL